jgi:hypothetical protein
MAFPLPKLNRQFYLGCVLLLAIAPTLQSPPAQGQSPYPLVPSPESSVCYLQIDRKTLHLDSLCGDRTGQTPASVGALSPQDQRFIREYKGLLKDFPELQATLLPVIQQNPQSLITRAITLCQMLRTPEMMAGVEPAIDTDILTALAPQYYCKDMDD